MKKYKNPEDAAFADLLRTYRRSAKKKGLPFELTEAQFKKLTKDRCYYCDQEAKQVYSHGRRSRGKYLYNGVDRKNSLEGYTKENCVTACGWCNKSKNSRSVDYWALHITQIVQHAVNKVFGANLPRYELQPEAVAATAPSPCDAEPASKPARRRKPKGN